ncbi:MAG: TldD/PmbA family protein [Candidatus Cloacimonetes bacterium]|nr:TldD/PmbA family protein [Candidatus Cloacimonadota bacterium]
MPEFRQNLLQLANAYEGIKFVFNYREWETDFLRFYQSQVNYNISKKSRRLNATVHKGKKSYSFGLDNPTKIQLIDKIDEALSIIDKLPEDTDFVDIENDLSKSDELEKTNNIDKVTLETKINILKEVAKAVEPYNFKIYGTFICNYIRNYFINSNGIDKREINSPIMLELKAVEQKNEVTVLEAYGSENFASFDQSVLIESLLRKVKTAGNEIVDVEPGEYEVILAPRCIGEFIMYLTSGMTARSLDSNQSFFADKVDKEVFPANITIYDSPHEPDMMNFDYNSDGMLYEKMMLIEKGVFRNFYVNNYYSHKLKMEKHGANGSAIVMDTGKSSLDDMISGIANGLYISSLHYMNFINQKETSLTGLTRDGTFLIENGKLTKVVNNLRFTEKITDILNGIIEIENKSYTIPYSENYGEFGIESGKMPHVRVKGFKISSSTKTI